MQALIITSHPGPSLAITGLTTLLAAQAAPHGVGWALTASALLAGQLSIGWSNDACDAGRDAAAGRARQAAWRGATSARRAVWTTAGVGAAAGLAMALVVGPVTGGLYALAVALGWAYNLGLKSSLASGVMYLLGFGLLPAYAASTLPGHPAARWQVTVGGRLARARRALRQRAARPGGGQGHRGGRPAPAGGRPVGPGAVRAVALALLLTASVLLLLGATRRWVAIPGLVAALLLAVASARGTGRVPFLAAIGIAAVDIVVFAAGGEALA